MDNSVNNNLNNDITNKQSSGVVQSTIGTTVAQPTPVASTTIQSAHTVTDVQVAQVNNSIPATTSPIQQNVVIPNNNVSKKNDTNTFLIVGLFVGFVLLAAIFLLVLLVTGVIGNRNRLTCTKTITENGYTHFSERFYKLEKGVFTQVENTDIYTYTSLTDEVYDEKFGPIVEIKSGVTTYGFGTQVKREGNVVTITSYNPNFFGYKLDKVKSDNAKEGFTCK